MIKKIRNYILNIQSSLWILLVILLVGIFFRTYDFRNGIQFMDDQARDSALVGRVIDGQDSWPVFGPKMNNTGATDGESFHLGAIYYYFQIISAKIFGNYPDKMAYPDLFFSILSIPLFYYFLRIYFEKKISLGLVGLYAISPFFIHYSRFAWNTNLIPFFTLLFLLSLYEIILNKNEKYKWHWVILFGVSLGVGFQLHAILLILFSVVAISSLIYLLKIGRRPWKEFLVIFAIFLFLNCGQIASEFKTGFTNTKQAINSSAKNNKYNFGKLVLLENDINCNLEANFYFLSSLGNGNCSHNFADIFTLKEIRFNTVSKLIQDLFHHLVLILNIIFSVAGFYLLYFYIKREKNPEKRIFLQLLSLYTFISFLITFPLSLPQFDDLRYFMHIFFMPYVLLGLFLKFIFEKIHTRWIGFSIYGAVFLFFFFTNVTGLYKEANMFLNNDRTCVSHNADLGEMELVSNYLLENSFKANHIYFGGDSTLPFIFEPLEYLIEKDGIEPIKIGARSDNNITEFDAPAFYISCKEGMKKEYPYEKVGNFYIFKINK